MLCWYSCLQHFVSILFCLDRVIGRLLCKATKIILATKRPYVAFGFCCGVCLIAIGLGAALVINSQSELHLVSAQEDSEDQNSKANEPLITSPTTQVINLVSLMGMSEDDAIQAIGHGATVQDQETLSSLGFSNEMVVLLADEKGDTYSGTPTVTLGLDAEGNVAAASYEAPCSLLGYGDVAFAPAVTQFHIVEFILEKLA